MEDELDSDKSLLEDVKDSLTRQITEVRKLIERKRGEVRTLELELSKEREQKTAKVILAVLRRGKALQSWREALTEGRESWGLELTASTIVLDSYTKALSVFQAQRLTTLHTLLTLLPLPPRVLHTLREASRLSDCLVKLLVEEEIGRDGVLERKETTMKDAQMNEVLLSQELQAIIGEERRHFPSFSFAPQRALHLKTKSCHQPTFDLSPSSNSVSLLFDLHNASLSLPDCKDSSSEEEVNRLAILNSSIRIKQEDREEKAVEAREEEVELQERRGWRRAVCPCLWRK